jgi:hypothetical protein
MTNNLYTVHVAALCVAFTTTPIPTNQKLVFYYSNKRIPPEGFIDGKFVRLFKNITEALNWLHDDN